MSDRERAKTGEYVETVIPEAVLDAVATHPDPTVTAREVGEAIGCSTSAARKKLTALHESGDVERKKVGGRSVVWWLTDEQPSPMPDAETAADRLDGFGLFSGEEGEAFAEAVEASREQFDEDYKERQRDLFGQ